MGSPSILQYQSVLAVDSTVKKNAYDTIHISNKFSYRHYHALPILRASYPTFLINIYHIVIDVLYLMFT